MVRELVGSTQDVDTIAPLCDLAARYGVSTEYWDWQGQRVPVKVGTVVAVLEAFGVPAGTLQEVTNSLHEAELAPWRRTLPAIVIGRCGVSADVLVHVPHGSAVTVLVSCEDGSTVPARQVDHLQPPREVDGVLTGQARFELPADLPLGWHEVVADVTGADCVRCPLVIAPQRLELPEHLQHNRSWGLMAQLYSVRSRRSWGVGDFGDLADLAAVGADLGADFVLVNPLHAAQSVPPIENSPYLPATRRFVNPLYIRVEDVPETGYLPNGQRAMVDAAHQKVQKASAGSDLIDRQTALAHKLMALELVFDHPRSPARQAQFDAYRRAEGDGLEQFATWSALCEAFGADRQWPQWANDPGSPELTAFAAEHAHRIEFFVWLQWIADEQLAAAQRAARSSGMGTGLITDLAVGVHPAGSDSWALGDVLARGVSVGAPPDAFNQLGQDWSQPPWRPDRLAEVAYEPYRAMLATVLRHCGGLRIDHVMGLFRLWCIPSGGSPAEGAYIRYDHEAMVSILLLEAHRAGAFVVGEDLGVVEPFVRDYLAQRGVAGTSILWFERDESGHPLPPSSYRELCLATVATHDLPPTAGYLAGEHIRLRQELGLLTRSVEQEEAADRQDRELVIDALRQRGLVGDDPSVEELIAGLHRYLTQSPARMVGVLVTDLVGDRRTQNQPGTSTEYPNWCIPLTDEAGDPVTVDDLATSDRARRLAQVLNHGMKD